MNQHSRACPKCGNIIPWTRGKKQKHTLRTGTVIESYATHLICPEHGEFRNPAEKIALERWNK